mgnify:CR=1 FL=1
MEIINKINLLEQISLQIPNRLLRLKGYVLKGECKQYLEIIIYKGFSSSTTHEIDTDLEKNFIKETFQITQCELLEAPFTEKDQVILKKNQNFESFLDKNHWD